MKIKKVLRITVSVLLISTIFCGLSSAASFSLDYNIDSNDVRVDIGNKDAINWAILICGSDDFAAGFESDIRDMYVLLTDELQFDDDNIYYVAPGNWNSATHYFTISKGNVQNAIQEVASKAAYQDSVFFFYTSHGKEYYLDGNGDTYIDSTNDVEATTLDSWLDGINVNQMLVLLQACKCGSFIGNLSSPKRIIITATDSTHSSWGDIGSQDPPTAFWDPNGPDDDGADNPYDRNNDGSEFSSGFRMAFRDFDNSGYKEADNNSYINLNGYSPKYPPTITGNKDGRVSISEAFYFAKFEDCLTIHWENHIYPQWEKEYPQIDANNIDPSVTYIYSNLRPSKPNIVGPSTGKKGTEYDFTFNAIDGDGDDLSYYVDWGDGTNTGWFGPSPSGVGVLKKHTWNSKDEFTIKAKAKDINGAESDENIFKVNIPRNKVFRFNVNLLDRLFERFPNAIPTLRLLLRL